MFVPSTITLLTLILTTFPQLTFLFLCHVCLALQNIIHNLVMVVLKLVDNFKGMVIRWRKKGNVSCGNVVSIRAKVVNVEGTNTPSRV